EERAGEYEKIVPEQDPFFINWNEFQEQARGRGMTLLKVREAYSTDEIDPECIHARGGDSDDSDYSLRFDSLEAFRPLTERAPDLPVAEAQRREFFAQLHRWSRQNFAVHVFCNNEGERQRFQEIWREYGLEPPGIIPEPSD